jgi:8-oxo-dGTP pyrophosphatase MutT (NUDIX family)
MDSPIYAGGFICDPSSRSVLLHLRDSNTSYNPNKWAFLGGLAKSDEKPVDAFCREVREETGITVKTSECKLILEYWHPEQKTKGFIYYVERSQVDTPVTLTEGKKVTWVPFSTALEYDLTHWTRQALLLMLGKEM